MDARACASQHTAKRLVVLRAGYLGGGVVMLEDRTRQLQLLEMMRDKDGKLIGLREFGPPNEGLTEAENLLLNAFVASYQAVMKEMTS